MFRISNSSLICKRKFSNNNCEILGECEYSRKPPKSTPGGFAESFFETFFNMDFSEPIYVKRSCLSANGVTAYTTRTEYANGKITVVNVSIEPSGKVEIERIINGKLLSKNVVFPAYRF